MAYDWGGLFNSVTSGVTNLANTAASVTNARTALANARNQQNAAAAPPVAQLAAPVATQYAAPAGGMSPAVKYGLLALAGVLGLVLVFRLVKK